MSGTDSKPTIITHGDGQGLIVKNGNTGLVAQFNAEGGLQLSHNGQTVTVFDPESGFTVSSVAAHDRPIKGAPAILWNRINGRLTGADVGQTILLKDRNGQDDPLIYIGNQIPYLDRYGRFRIYAAITDARDENGNRLYLTFGDYVKFLNDHPKGEKLKTSEKPGFSYETVMFERIEKLKPGERTGQMIPPYLFLRGEGEPGDEVTCSNMYDLRYTFDFAKVDNGGYDSRFVTGTGSTNAHCYVSCSTHFEGNVFGAYFTNGGGTWRPNRFSLRPVVVEMPKL